MNSNNVMFGLLIIFILVTLVAIVMCFMNNGTGTNADQDQDNSPVTTVVKDMNRTYNRFYWGNSELN